ncbi:GTP-binding protein [Aliarcobacter cryaerophilus]|uniref:CobW family GTP-binding protein n=1 Tax=Aliarcobacter cryaerophilus TaxID=28198 RepID=UPI0021B5F8F9|nr:CobW family GTP-binding protein [Aliarcobacter cryaerophilus]MCT7466835.1 GTP-binding protein [Aliarcobacter cryaerophilus]
MSTDRLYSNDFNGSARSYNSLMRNLLIKANYDGILKKVTGYKGMYLSDKDQECWTLKFDDILGVYGLLLFNIKEDENDFIGEFNLYYFPSKEEKYANKCSLLEEYLLNNDSFIEQVRDFSSYSELFLHFKIAKIEIKIPKEKDALIISYLTETKTRIITKDGILDTLDLTNSKYIIEPKGIDKDFPSLRLTLPFFNFLNTLITRINNEAPSFFEIEKEQGESLTYDHTENVSFTKDISIIELNFILGYGKVKNKYLNIKEERKNTYLRNLMKLGTWHSTQIDFNKFTNKFRGKNIKSRLIVIAGFLGSGKTSFLQNFIEYETQANRFVGIIQNEIGKVGLDAKLLDYNYSMVEIDEGCVCCSLAGQLRAGVLSLLQKSTPDIILLETTGVANPFNLLSELDELKDIIEFESIITVVDAKNCIQHFREYKIFKDQIRAADTILLNKIDLVTEEELQEVENLLKRHNKCAHILRTVNCEINPTLVSNYAKLISSSSALIASEFTEESTIFRTHKMDNLSSIKKELPYTLNRDVFIKHLKSIDNDIVRIKGVVQFTDSDKQFLIQFVNKTFEISQLDTQLSRENFLIYIGKDMHTKNIVIE